VLMSSPGPIVVGTALFFGRSSTQFADFIRRTAELGAIIVSWIVFRIVNRKNEIDTAYRNKLERTANLCVGAAMCLSGAAMLFIALFSPDTEKGNVIPGLVIAVLGVITTHGFGLDTVGSTAKNRMRYLRYKAGFIVQRLLSMPV